MGEKYIANICNIWDKLNKERIKRSDKYEKSKEGPSYE